MHSIQFVDFKNVVDNLMRFAAWLEADPAHRAAFTATEKTWEEAGLIDPSLLENESRTEKGCLADVRRCFFAVDNEHGRTRVRRGFCEIREILLNEAFKAG